MGNTVRVAIRGKYGCEHIKPTGNHTFTHLIPVSPVSPSIHEIESISLQSASRHSSPCHDMLQEGSDTFFLCVYLTWQGNRLADPPLRPSYMLKAVKSTLYCCISFSFLLSFFFFKVGDEALWSRIKGPPISSNTWPHVTKTKKIKLQHQ